MKIAVMGSGGVGGYFGAKLALAGNDVTFIARGPHLKAMQNKGLKIETDSGELHVNPVQATDDPSTIGQVDAVLFCTKLYDTIEAAESLKPIMGPNTFIVTVQNGVSGPDLIGGVLGEDRVMGGSTYIISHIKEPGVIHHIGTFQRIVFGELDGTLSDRGRAFEKACADADIDVELTDRIQKAMWEKFIPLTVMSGMTAATRLPIGPILDDSRTAALVDAAIEEVVAVGKAKGIPLADDAAPLVQGGVRSAPYETKSSMLVDLERGKKMELPWLSETVAKFGEETGVPTPTHTFIAAVLGPHAGGASKA